MSDGGSLPVALKDDAQDLFDNAPCGYLSLSPDGRIAAANQRIAGWLGYQPVELVQRFLKSVLSVPARVYYETTMSPLLRLQGFVDEVAADFLAKDGSKVPCLINAAERRDLDGNLLFTRLAVFRATARRRYERSLVNAKNAIERAAEAERETSQLREQFIAVLGHDLPNPLASIHSGIRLLTNREPMSARAMQILNLMQGSVFRASELIDNVLDFARGRLGGGLSLNRNASSPLAPVLEQVVAELATVHPNRQILPEFSIADPVDCDRVRLGQLLSNLLGNALTHGSKLQPILVQAHTRDDTLVISVANGGNPIDQTTMARLFHPFFRGNEQSNTVGLGLGLHIASEIAVAHGGVLTVNSNAEETRFTFTMPLVATHLSA